MERSISTLRVIAFVLAAVAKGSFGIAVEVGQAPLKFGSFTVYSENDFYFAGTDRHYTNGFKLSWLSTDLNSFDEVDLPSPVLWIAKRSTRLIDPTNQPKIGLSIGQNIYTPADIHTTVPQLNDRPYAAWLYVGASLQNYIPDGIRADGTHRYARLHALEVNVGVAGGPAALGEFIQNHWHDMFGLRHAEGWSNQIHNEPGLDIIYETRWRFSAGNPRTGFGADLIPHAGLCIGNVATYTNAGGELRVGYRMPADFGTNLIRPSGDTNPPTRESFSIFLFGTMDGRAVARDITLDGNSFRSSPSVPKEPLVLDVAGGIGIGTRRFQLTYTQAQRSREFKGQSDAQVFGSISFSVFF